MKSGRGVREVLNQDVSILFTLFSCDVEIEGI